MAKTLEEIQGMNLQVGDKIEIDLKTGKSVVGYYQSIFDGTRNEKQLAISGMDNGKLPMNYELSRIQEVKKLKYENQTGN